MRARSALIALGLPVLLAAPLAPAGTGPVRDAAARAAGAPADAAFLRFDRVRVRAKSGSQTWKQSPDAVELDLYAEGEYDLGLGEAGTLLSGAWRARRVRGGFRAVLAPGTGWILGPGLRVEVPRRAVLVLRTDAESGHLKASLRVVLVPADPDAGGGRRVVRARGRVEDRVEAAAAKQLLRARDDTGSGPD